MNPIAPKTKAQRTFLGLSRVTWSDVHRAISFKTFYLGIVTSLVGVVFILLDRVIFGSGSDSMWHGVMLALGITLVTSSSIAILSEMFMKLDMMELVSQSIREAITTVGLAQSNEVTNYGVDRSSLDFPKFWRESTGYLKIIGFRAPIKTVTGGGSSR